MSLRTSVLAFLFLILFSPAHAQGVDVFAAHESREKPFSRQEFLNSLEPASNNFKIGARNTQRQIQNQPQRLSALPSLNAAPTQQQFATQRFTPPSNQQGNAASALENAYSERIVDQLEQFGYDLFGVPNNDTRAQLDSINNTRPLGALQDDFILSNNDEIEIVFTGQRTDRGIYKINDRGVLTIPNFPPVPAAGRSIGQVRVSIQAAASNLHNTQIYVSLASVRQIGALVIGHVKRPGRQTMTVFHTVLDALMAAGGIDEKGSLRQVKLVRGGRSGVIDLYSLLLHGNSSPDLRLQDGDRIVVPAIGPTVAIAGEVKRPGIYEILPVIHGMHHKPDSKSEKLSLNEMLELGGGVLAPGKNRHIKLEITPQGEERVAEVSEPFTPLFGDGSILMISKGSEKRAGTVELQGHTRRPGLHALSENPALSDLLSSADILEPEAYPLIGVIERWDADQLASKMISFPLRLALKDQYDRTLNDGDVIHLFSNEQIKNLNKSDPQASAENLSLGSREFGGDHQRFINDDIMASFLRERAVSVRGAVRSNGAYPVGEGTSLESLLAVAGGISLEADTGNIEITTTGGETGTQRNRINLKDTRPADVMVSAGDSVRVNQKFKKIKDKSVLIIGEVHNPGRYDLMPGDQMSDLIDRAGGFTEQAYAEGAIFSRESERRTEEVRFRTQATELKRSIAAALERDDRNINEGKIAETRALAEELENAEALGRITVEADPAILAAKPELDVLLEIGDRVYIPKRSLNVRVRGEVLSPASLQFRERKDPLTYIQEAGGFTFNADKRRSFVLYPDGSAQPLKVSSWNHKATFIPPGSTIVIPRDPKPFDFIESAKDISQILSNLAITAIFIDDVRDDG